MPSISAIVWSSISGLILIMFGIIGYLISSGFDGLKYQLKEIWNEIKRHQTQAETNTLRIVAIETRCKELHCNRRRATDEQEDD